MTDITGKTGQLTHEERERLRELCEKATASPWRVVEGDEVKTDAGKSLLYVGHRIHSDDTFAGVDEYHDAARNALPALLDMAEECERLAREVELQKAVLARDVEKMLLLKRAGPDGNGGFAMELSSEFMPMIAAMLAEWFRNEGGVNYVGMTMHHHELGEFDVVMQRREGKSPVEIAGEAKEECERLRGIVREMADCVHKCIPCNPDDCGVGNCPFTNPDILDGATGEKAGE